MALTTQDLWSLGILYFWLFSSKQVQRVVVGIEQTSCPTPCICEKNTKIKCVNKSLETLPGNISKSATYLDISRNENIRIPEKYFTKFLNLKYLDVSACGLERPLDLPKKLMTLNIDHNKLSFNAFRLMLSCPSRFFRFIYARNMNVTITTRKPLLKASSSITTLYLRFNVMPTIYKETFKNLHNLSILDLRNMNIKQIEDHAFDALLKLLELYLDNNSILSLPQNLFSSLGNLRSLTMKNCQLKSFPNLTGLPSNIVKVDLSNNAVKDISSIIDMRIKSIKIFRLSGNSIRNLLPIVFQTIAAREIDICNNSLQRIEAHSFSGCEGSLKRLILCYNNIAYLSSDAFKGLTQFQSLLLFGNKITSIPVDLFTGMTIEDLFFYSNNISQLPPIWKAMKKPPSKILLFDNPLARISDMAVKHNQIYLTCNKLQIISIPIGADSAINCNSRNTSFQLPYDRRWILFAGKTGYSCTLSFRSKLGKKFSNMSCRPCQVGYFMRQADLKSTEWPRCRRCPPGSFYQDQIAQKQCKSCPLGQYVPPEKAPGKSPLECITCPEGTKTHENAGFRACRCLDGFFRRYRFGHCVKCRGKGIHCKGDYQILRPNYWWRWDYNKSCLSSYLAFVDNLKTENEKYSRDSWSFHCEMPKAHKCLFKNICLGGIHAKCRKGYSGPLCALCQKGYYKHFKSCARCPQLWIVCLQFFAYLVIFVFVCALVSWADRLIVNLSNGEERSLSDVILSLLKILLGFYQVLGETVTSFSYIPWPETLNTALKIFKYIELELLRLPSLRCISHSWRINAITDLWITLLVTVLVPAVMYLYYAIRKHTFYRTCRTKQELIEKVDGCKKSCFRSTMIFLFATYPITSKRILQLLPFSCHNICYDSASQHCVSLIKADFSLNCLSFETKPWLLYFVYACTAIPVGFPVLLLLRLFHLFRSRKYEDPYVTLNADECDDEQSYWLAADEILETSGPMVRKETTNFALKFLHENYKASCWYWEVIEMYRKLMLTCVLPIFVSESRIMLDVAIMFSSFFTVLHAYAKPIKNGFENLLQLISLSVIPVNLCTGYILETIAKEKGGAAERAREKLGISVLLLILNSLLIIVVLMHLLKIQIRKVKVLLSDDQCSCRCCLACVLPCVSCGVTDMTF